MSLFLSHKIPSVLFRLDRILIINLESTRNISQTGPRRTIYRVRISNFLIYDRFKMISVVLIDKRIFGGGIAMIVVGVALGISIGEGPTGYAGMSEEEIIDLMIAEDENQGLQLLYGLLIGVGFLLVLISFGARRKKGSAKRTEKKPAE